MKYALLLCAWAGLLYVVRGNAAFDAKRVTFLSVIVLYGIGGPVTGALVGLLRPLARTLVGAVLVGMVAAVPVSIAVATMVVDVPAWSGAHTFVASTTTIFLGGLCGALFREFLGGPDQGAFGEYVRRKTQRHSEK